MNNNTHLAFPYKEYISCYVAYIDILGFKNLIKKLDPNTIYSTVTDLLQSSKIFCGISNNSNMENKSISPLRLALISDALLLFTADDSEKSFKILTNSLATIIQKGIYQPPFLLRGAIAKGDFYFDIEAQIYFGPTLIECIEWEEKQEWMGVILTPNCSSRDIK